MITVRLYKIVCTTSSTSGSYERVVVVWLVSIVGSCQTSITRIR